MTNLLSKITNHCGKVFTLLGFLLHGFSQQVFCGEKEKIAYINLVKLSFQGKENELIQKAFSQPLALMGLEKSPLTEEIFQKKNLFQPHFRYTQVLFKALILKAMIHLFDEDLMDFRKKEVYLDFNENPEGMIIEEKKMTNAMDFFFHVNNINVTTNIIENLEKMSDKNEKTRYFFKNFNTFAKNKDISYSLLYTERYLDSYKNAEIFFKFKEFLDIFQEDCGNDIGKYFSKDFFVTSHRKLFPCFNDIEYLAFFNSLFLINNINLKKLSQNIYCILEKNMKYLNISGDVFTFMMTEKKFHEAFQNLVIPLKSFFTFHYYNASWPKLLPLNTSGSFYLPREWVHEAKLSRTLALQDIEPLYIKNALQNVYKIFFISFMDKFTKHHKESFFSYDTLEKFQVKSYNYFLFLLQYGENKDQIKRNKDSLGFQEAGIYVSPDFLNFVMISKGAIAKTTKHIEWPFLDNFLSFCVPEELCGDIRYFVKCAKNEKDFFNSLKKYLDILTISNNKDHKYLRNLALQRIKVMELKLWN